VIPAQRPDVDVLKRPRVVIKGATLAVRTGLLHKRTRRRDADKIAERQRRAKPHRLDRRHQHIAKPSLDRKALRPRRAGAGVEQRHPVEPGDGHQAGVRGERIVERRDRLVASDRVQRAAGVGLVDLRAVAVLPWVDDHVVGLALGAQHIGDDQLDVIRFCHLDLRSL